MRNVFAMVFSFLNFMLCGISTWNMNEYRFHEEFTILPKESSGNQEDDNLYIYFGDWPQSIKSPDITIDETKTITMGFNTYYLGSDNCYYAKVAEHGNSPLYKYSDGSSVGWSWPRQKSIKYFKVEPIKWRVLTKDYKGTKRALLLAENILDARIPFYDDCYNFCDYDSSSVRAYLNTRLYKNECFLKSAFTEAAQKKIPYTELENQNGKKLVDKIFLLSLEEIKNNKFYFGEQNSNGRIKYPSDYVLAKGIFKDINGGSPWWLRSTESTCGKAWCISHTGNEVCYEAEDLGNGISPALTISLHD